MFTGIILVEKTRFKICNFFQQWNNRIDQNVPSISSLCKVSFCHNVEPDLRCMCLIQANFNTELFYERGRSWNRLPNIWVPLRFGGCDYNSYGNMLKGCDSTIACRCPLRQIISPLPTAVCSLISCCKPVLNLFLGLIDQFVTSDYDEDYAFTAVNYNVQ